MNFQIFLKSVTRYSPGDNFSGNNGLCGRPLGKCGGLSGKSLRIIIVAGVIWDGRSLILG